MVTLSSLAMGKAMGESRGMVWLGLLSRSRRNRNQTGMRFQRRGAESAEISAEKTQNRVTGRSKIQVFGGGGARRKYPANSGESERVCGGAESRGHRTRDRKSTRLNSSHL